MSDVNDLTDFPETQTAPTTFQNGDVRITVEGPAESVRELLRSLVTVPEVPPAVQGDPMRRQRGNAKLTPELVRLMRRRYQEGETQGSLAKAFGLNINTVYNVVTRRSWKGVDCRATAFNSA